MAVTERKAALAGVILETFARFNPSMAAFSERVRSLSLNCRKLVTLVEMQGNCKGAVRRGEYEEELQHLKMHAIG